MRTRRRIWGARQIPVLWSWLIAVVALCKWRAEGYDFRLESTSFSGKGLMGDFGDFDNSGHLDFVTYSYDSARNISTIYIYGEIKKGDEGKPYRTFEVDGECDGLTCADLNTDNFLDIMLIMKKKWEPRDQRQLYYLLLYTQVKKDTFTMTWDSRTPVDVLLDQVEETAFQREFLRLNTVPREVYEYSTIHPLVADFDGDGFADVMTQGTNMELIFWMNLGTTLVPFHHGSVPTVRFIGDLDGFIPNPHSCAFIDMNGDCRPDLVLVKESKSSKTVNVEIWLAEVPSATLNYRKWKSGVELELPEHHGMLTFADFNGDGTFDMMVPFCDRVDEQGYCKTPCKLGLAYNQQMPFCAQMFKAGDQDCRNPSNLCSASQMTFTPFTDRENVIELQPEHTFIYPMGTHGVSRVTEKFNNREAGPDDKFTKLPTQLARVMPGDFNNNGYLDVIVPLKVRKQELKMAKGSKKDKGPGKLPDNPDYLVMIVKNTAKSRQSAQFDVFIPITVKDPNAVLTHVATADIIDRRVLNLLVFMKNGEKLMCCYYTTFKETLDLFMKLMTKYIVIEESKYPDNYFISGSNNNGLTYKLTVIDINGMKFPRIACLRPQTAYTPLFTPFAFIGLGKTNNYVEEFYLGVSSSSKNYKHMWISIIPSCTVVTVPIPLHTPTQWSLKLSIIPGKKLFAILLTTSISLVIFGVIILIFDFKEKREDFIQAKGFRQKFIIN